MSELWNRLQALLLDPAPSYNAFHHWLRASQGSGAIVGDDIPRSEVARRLALALEGLAEQRAGTADIAVLLRQVIRTFKRRLEVKQQLWQLLRAREEMNALRVTATHPDSVEIDAGDWQPSWLLGAATIDLLERRRTQSYNTGDGLLYAMSGHLTYRSRAQEAAVHASLFAAPGSTTLITLPTGGGKSLCVLLPAWSASRGGRIKGGTSLVIVPTVSLAIDQEKQAHRYFRDAVNDEYRPHSRTADTPVEVKETIRKGLRNGTLPILFTSPESLLQSELYGICLEAAARGTLNYLVIDEAHLVETWGAGFRTDFQLLAAFRQRLVEASRGTLRTLLLSATVTYNCENVLERLFAPDTSLNIVRANQLRPEPSFWFDRTPDPSTRRRHVLEALRYLPRPLILYTTRPEDALVWYHLLRDEGYQRVAAYTGQTESDERRRLMAEWDRNERDIMVANSAFGVGVDKGDVRSIVHACLPENLDRFYQEVGRAGRDGYASISLLCTEPGDRAVAEGITASAVITPEKAWQRWEGMRMSARFDTAEGSVMRVDVNAPPWDQPEMQSGEKNQEWNEHTLLLLQRAGLLRIEETSLYVEEEANTLRPQEWRQIRLARPLQLERKMTFVEAITPVRDSERQQVSRALDEMEQLLDTYSSTTTTPCVATILGDLYPQTALACGGCPSCRARGERPYVLPVNLTLELSQGNPSAHYLDGEFRDLLGSWHTLNITWEGRRTRESLAYVKALLLKLLEKGIQQFVLPSALIENNDWILELVRSMSTYAEIPHLLLSDEWIRDALDSTLFPLPTALLYPPDDRGADEFHVSVERHWTNALHNTPRVNIVHDATYLASAHGLFKDRIDGIDINVDAFLQRLEQAEEVYRF